MAISIPISVLPSGELLKILRCKFPIDSNGGQKVMLLFFSQTASILYFWTRNRLHPFLTLNTVRRWVLGIPKTNFPILLCKTGSRLRENFGGIWKTFRVFHPWKYGKDGIKTGGDIGGKILGFEISDNTCVIFNGVSPTLEAFKENSLCKSSQPNQWDV